MPRDDGVIHMTLVERGIRDVGILDCVCRRLTRCPTLERRAADRVSDNRVIFMTNVS
jgi:hypothetical protein